MSLKLQGYIDLPGHQQDGGFDHAAIHPAKHLLYAAHTSNDALDVIDCASDLYLRSIPNLTGVAGALVSEERDLIFTSNRGEDTVSIFLQTMKPSQQKLAWAFAQTDSPSTPNADTFSPRMSAILRSQTRSLFRLWMSNAVR